MPEEVTSLTPPNIQTASAFANYTNIKTTFADGLEKSIIELAEKQGKLLMSEIISRFGNYPTVHRKVKKMVLENKLILTELETGSIANCNFSKQELRLSDPSLSQWVDLTANPCLTCQIHNECAIDNPVSPSTCPEFNDWLSEEIDLLFGPSKE